MGRRGARGFHATRAPPRQQWYSAAVRVQMRVQRRLRFLQSQYYVARRKGGVCSLFHFAVLCCTTFTETFNPKVAGSIPARPIPCSLRDYADDRRVDSPHVSGRVHTRGRRAIRGAVSQLDDHRGDRSGRPGQTLRFTLANRPFIAFNSPIAHDFGFTPSMSIFVTCDTPDEVDELFGKLSTDGAVLMPPDDYGFSPRFGWCTDRHGVSWQVGCT